MSYTVVKFKKLHPDAKIPIQGTDGSAGFDLTAISKEMTKEGIFIYDTGLALEIPKGYYGEVKARSSIFKTHLSLCNGTGLIDSDYRGSIKFYFYVGNYGFRHSYVYDELSYKVGDRIGQILVLPYPRVFFVESEQLSETKRGEGGFGSTGVNTLSSLEVDPTENKEVLLTANPEE